MPKIIIVFLQVAFLSGISGYLIGVKIGEGTKSSIISKSIHTVISPTPNILVIHQVSPTKPVFIPSSTVTPFPVPSIDITSWLTYTNSNDNFTMRYPATFVTQDTATYEGGGTEKYIVDSQMSIEKWQTNNKNQFTNQNIIIESLYLTIPYADDQSHTEDEK
jgi:hypothetical protein